MRTSILALAFGCIVSVTTAAAAQRLSDLAPYLIADRAAEVALARTAAR
jgi:hypothetical protein